MAELAMVTVVVRDYDEAVAWFVAALGFELAEDMPLGSGKRWVVVRPAGSAGAGVLLARAANERQAERVGDQAGGRVAFFLHTGDLDADLARLAAAGVAVVDGPRQEVYGRVAVFEDLYGNRWDLVEPCS